MKFFTVLEILNSILFSLASGIVFGGIYSASESILIFLKEMLFIFPNAIRLLPFLSRKTFHNNTVIRKKIKLSSIERNIFEAFIFSFFGIVMILVSYVALDGYIRLYIFISAAIFSFLSYKFIGKKFSSVFDRIFREIYFITVLLLSLLLFPIYKTGAMLIPVIKKAFGPLIRAVIKKRSERLLKIKLKEIRDMMKLNT
jgi:hypothetical protein